MVSVVNNIIAAVNKIITTVNNFIAVINLGNAWSWDYEIIKKNLLCDV